MEERPAATKVDDAEKALHYARLEADQRDARIKEELRQRSLFYGGDGTVWQDPETGEYRYDGDRAGW